MVFWAHQKGNTLSDFTPVAVDNLTAGARSDAFSLVTGVENVNHIS